MRSSRSTRTGRIVEPAHRNCGGQGVTMHFTSGNRGSRDGLESESDNDNDRYS